MTANKLQNQWRFSFTLHWNIAVSEFLPCLFDDAYVTIQDTCLQYVRGDDVERNDYELFQATVPLFVRKGGEMRTRLVIVRPWVKKQKLSFQITSHV
jgi:hypothetical protein